MSFKDDFIASRRLFILRLLVELNGEANESVITSAAQHAGFGQSTRDDIRQDLDHLRGLGCMTESWAGAIRVAHVTERGEDAAHGRVEVAGVERSRWDKA